MILIYNCDHCRHSNVLPINAVDRVELRDDSAKDLERKCYQCGGHFLVNPNRVRAKVSNRRNSILIIIATVLSIILALLVLNQGQGWRG